MSRARYRLTIKITSAVSRLGIPDNKGNKLIEIILHGFSLAISDSHFVSLTIDCHGNL